MAKGRNGPANATAFNWKEFSKRLWGNQYLHSDRKFRSEPEHSEHQRSFVQFILDPIYKIFSHTLGAVDLPALKAFLPRLGVKLLANEMEMDPKPLLKLIFSRFFGSTAGVVSMIADNCPNPVDSAVDKITRHYRGNQKSPEAQAMRNCSAAPETPFVCHIVKQYHAEDGASFLSLGRIFSGSIRPGEPVRILNEQFSLADQEGQTIRSIDKVYLPAGRFNIELSEARAGAIVLLSGIEAGISKSATLVSLRGAETAETFRPIQYSIAPLMKLALEPLKPNDLPKMLEALRKIDKSYPVAQLKVEETGEHLLFGPGEMFFDCALQDLREVYSDIEVRVADPVVKFTETVSEVSYIKASAESPNHANKLGAIALPMDDKLIRAVADGRISAQQDERSRSLMLQSDFQWDVLAARSLWAFGPDEKHPNILVDETLPSETNKRTLFSLKDSIVQGFEWACRSGPLIEEPVRGVKFQLMEGQFASEPLLRARGQIIPAMKRVSQCAFLLAKPRLMEPIYAVEIVCNSESIATAVRVVQKRRGHIASQNPIPGSVLFQINAFLPLIDSFGFETDLRSLSRGQAFCSSWFDHWKLVPGDPLDKNQVTRPLEQALPEAMARDFLLKTRRRKGLTEDVAIGQLFDTELILKLAAKEAEKERERMQMMDDGNGNI